MARSLRGPTRARRRRRTSQAANPSSVSATAISTASARSSPARNSISAPVHARPATPAPAPLRSRAQYAALLTWPTTSMSVARSGHGRADRVGGRRRVPQPRRHLAAAGGRAPDRVEARRAAASACRAAGSVCTQIAIASTHSCSPTCSCVVRSAQRAPIAAAPRANPSPRPETAASRAMRSSRRRRIHRPIPSSSTLAASASETSCTMRASASSRGRGVGPDVGQARRAGSIVVTRSSPTGRKLPGATLRRRDRTPNPRSRPKAFASTASRRRRARRRCCSCATANPRPAHPDRPFPIRDGHGDPAARSRRRAAGRAPRANGSRHEPITAIYVTTLRRTHQTAAPLAAHLGLTPIEEPDLREVFLGEWEEGEFRKRGRDARPDLRADLRPGALGRDPRRGAARRVRRPRLARLPTHRRRASRRAGRRRVTRRRDRSAAPPRHRTRAGSRSRAPTTRRSARSSPTATGSSCVATTTSRICCHCCQRSDERVVVGALRAARAAAARSARRPARPG